MPGVYEMSISGDMDLVAAMKEIREDMVDKIAPHGLRAYMRVVVKAVKAEFPAHMKDAKKAIGYRVRKVNPRTGEVDAKFGARVGLNAAKQKQLAVQASSKRDPDRPGVGISAQNIHWYMAGTGKRTQKTTGKNTGTMPANSVLFRGYALSKQQALAAFKDAVHKDMVKRVKKQKRKARARISKSVIGSVKKAAFGGLI